MATLNYTNEIDPAKTATLPCLVCRGCGESWTPPTTVNPETSVVKASDVAAMPSPRNLLERGGDSNKSNNSWLEAGSAAHNTVLCGECVADVLRNAQERHDTAQQQWLAAREACRQSQARFIHQNHEKEEYTTTTTVNDGSGGNDDLGGERVVVSLDDVAAWHDECQTLRTRVEALRAAVADAAVQSCANRVVVEERHATLHQEAHTVATHRATLLRLRQTILGNSNDCDDGGGGDECEDGALVQGLADARNQVCTLRWQWARQALRMHRLHVEPGDNPRCHNSTQMTNGDVGIAATKHSNSSNNITSSNAKDVPAPPRRRSMAVSGIGKIGGLPLPHAGPELFGVLPPHELQSALRLVAQVTHLIARCLGIVLPHPIWLRPPPPPPAVGGGGAVLLGGGSPSAVSSHGTRGTPDDDIANLAYPEDADPISSHYNNGHSNFSNTYSSEIHKVNPSSLTSSITAALQGQIVGRPEVPALDVDPVRVRHRIRHAVAAVLAEDRRPGATLYALSAEVVHQDEFAIALQLLQNDVIALCIRSGVPVQDLWPGEALLGNLFALQCHCESQVQKSDIDQS